MKNPKDLTRPIGIFDSGVGGLTIAKSISQLLPNERIIYFGDTVNMPYGDKTTADIRNYSAKIANFLELKACKVILIACNSATVAAYEYIENRTKTDVLVLNVIDPLVEHLAANYVNKRVGLIGTPKTIHSGIYKQLLFNSGVELRSRATRLLAPAIEEFGDHPLVDKVIAEYLSDPAFQDLDAILLGCTHYPLVKDKIAAFYHDKVEVIDSAKIIAECTKTQLKKFSYLNPNPSQDPINHKRFFVSQEQESFTKISNRLFKDEDISIENRDL